MAKKKKKEQNLNRLLITLILLFIPISIIVLSFAYDAWEEFKQLPIIEQLFHEETEVELLMKNFDLPIPVEYIPIYKAAAETYGIHWPLLAAHHRIETRFSTMKSDISPVGAEGPMQVRP